MSQAENLHRPIDLGIARIPGNLFLAPTAGYSDAAYRSLCFELGADLCYTEMVSAEALTRGHPATKELLARSESERVFAIQLFGAKPEVLARAAALVLPYRPLLVDLNCGCPVPKIVKSGAGSALMRSPGRIGAIVRAMREVLEPEGIPVTVKIRSGWDAEHVNFREIAAEAVEAGARALTLHARTRAQGYSGRADWSQIAELARSLPVPVFGSGDAVDGESARRMILETGAAGVMVARGAMGNPFVFTEIRAALEGRRVEAVAVREKAGAAWTHLERSAFFLGEKRASVEFRKHFCAYTKGSPQGALLRAEAVKAGSLAEFHALLDRWVAASEAASRMSMASASGSGPGEALETGLEGGTET